jgi:hypothetical protein
VEAEENASQVLFVMLFAYFLFLLCTFPSCLSQGNLLQIFTDFRVINNNGTHLTFSWNQASNATSSASYFIHYAQVDFDHDDDSKHIQAPVLLRTGNSYTYSFPKEQLLPDGLYGTLYFYVRVSFSSQNWYTNGLSVATGLGMLHQLCGLSVVNGNSGQVCPPSMYPLYIGLSIPQH